MSGGSNKHGCLGWFLLALAMFVFWFNPPMACVCFVGGIFLLTDG